MNTEISAVPLSRAASTAGHASPIAPRAFEAGTSTLSKITSHTLGPIHPVWTRTDTPGELVSTTNMLMPSSPEPSLVRATTIIWSQTLASGMKSLAPLST